MYITGSSSSNKITGLATGMDIDQMVADLMGVERIPYDNKYKELQSLQWKMESYRDVIDVTQTFKNQNFDLLNPSSNLMSASGFVQYENSYSVDNILDIQVLDNNASIQDLEVTVEALATSEVIYGDQAISKDIVGINPIDFPSLNGNQLIIEVDGGENILDIEGVNDMADLQNLIDRSIGSDKVVVQMDGGGVISITAGAGVQEVTMTGSALSPMGFNVDSICNRIDETMTLQELSSNLDSAIHFDVDGFINIEINSIPFQFSEEDSLDHMMDEINQSEAGVSFYYDEFTDAFKLTSDETGSGVNIIMGETDSDFFSAIGLDNRVEGTDAKIYIDGNLVVRDTNSFEINGIKYNLKSTCTEPVEISISQDEDFMFDSIVGFVDSYNALLEELKMHVDEEKDYDYEPLTQEEKDAMSEDEIELWEEQAKKGLLNDDPLIETMMDELRRIVYSPVEGLELSLYDIGITTASYDQGGQLVIDSNKLQEAISNNYDDIVTLFTKESSSFQGTNTNRDLSAGDQEIRFNEEGISARLYDTIEKYVSTYRDSNGQKGLLVEKSGIENDVSNYNNLLYEQISNFEDELLAMEEKLDDKETYYYNKFTSMEVAISQMNSELTAMMSMFQ